MARRRIITLVAAAVGALVGMMLVPWSALADVVVPDDQIIQGSQCVGFDCVNGEVFGFDTIRLKENNLRIGVDDTSSAAGFPANDWQLTFNDSINGGKSKFSLDDITGAKTPFTVEAGARTDALYVNAAGKIGIGTGTPVIDVHLRTGNTPGVRLEQDGTSGFTAQTWDVAANEANFFIRDVTSGSRLPFRIRPGAPTSSIDVANDGDVGFRVSSPAAPIHLKLTAGEASGANGELLLLERLGAGFGIKLLDSDTGVFFTSGITDGAGNYVVRHSSTPTGRGQLTVQSSGVIQLRLLETAPATALKGQIYVDSSGAFCVATATDTWTNVSGVGSCV